MANSLQVRQLGCIDYATSLAAMRHYTDNRGDNDADNLWLLEHPAVFTQGQAGSDDYLLAPGDIPVIQSDRGGHVTYHGPGQITAYLLLDLRRLGLGVRDLVTAVEHSIIATCADYQVTARARRDAPGVYTANGAKIASLGLRVRRGCSYHGLNFNIDMDMQPWQRINPCGLGVAMTQLKEHVEPVPTIDEVSQKLTEHLAALLGYQQYTYAPDNTLGHLESD
ncbi:lipoyl(octanoyl) transferase LipB [Porticoccaceae bacterium]|nr:lipoyl(octanoyl) transferase LipB [Porticoccaceae bacterium]